MIIPIKVSQRSYSVPVITILIVAVNVMVFLYQFSMVDPRLLNRFMRLYSLRPAFLFSHPATLVTSMFLHSGWFHIMGNMLFLWVFGNCVEDLLGHFKYLLFYLACGVVAGLTQVVFDPFSHIPIVGASGAIAGVMGAYLIKFPKSYVVMLVFVIFIFTFDLPAWLMLIYWFLLQLLGGFGSITGSEYAQTGGVAFFAHVGGFVAGIVLMRLLGPRQRRWRADEYTW